MLIVKTPAHYWKTYHMQQRNEYQKHYAEWKMTQKATYCIISSIWYSRKDKADIDMDIN